MPKKLTLEDVAVIRQRLSAGERQADIAAAYGIAQQHVSRIKRGVSWNGSREV